jgi:hypothetical protein
MCSSYYSVIHKITFICTCVVHTTVSSCIQVKVLVHFSAVWIGERCHNLLQWKICVLEKIIILIFETFPNSCLMSWQFYSCTCLILSPTIKSFYFIRAFESIRNCQSLGKGGDCRCYMKSSEVVLKSTTSWSAVKNAMKIFLDLTCNTNI